MNRLKTMKFKYHNRGQGQLMQDQRLDRQEMAIFNEPTMLNGIAESPIVGGVIAVEPSEAVQLPMVDSNHGGKQFDTHMTTSLVAGAQQSTHDASEAQEDFQNTIDKVNSR